MTISEHFKKDRADRYAFIATTIGVGTVVHSFKQTFTKYGDEPCTVQITSTGVAMIVSPEDKMVTMYVITLKEAEKYLANCAAAMVLKAIIKKNMKNQYHILQNEVKYQRLAAWEK